MNSSTTIAQDDPASHLTIILDLNPGQWHASSLATQDQPLSLTQFLSQFLAFINAHLASKDDNTVAVIGALPGYSIMLYRSDDPLLVEQTADRLHANSYQPFRLVDASLTKRIQEELEKSALTEGQQDNGLVGAISKALCHINRVTQASTSAPSEDHSTPTQATTSPRLLILSVSSDLSTSYIPLMNSIFAAQKLKVKIDVCRIFGSDTVFLQQASFLTGGSYLSLERRDALLQYLSMCFLPPPSLRRVLATPTQEKVDFRAACFCHKKIVDMGYVCSVCLSIFCRPVPVCSTCRTKFPLKTLQRLGFGRQLPTANGHAKATPNGTS